METAEEAREIAATRRGAVPAMALVLAESASTENGRGEDREQVAATQILIGAGWRAALVTADTPLTAAWQELQRYRGRSQPGLPGAAASSSDPAAVSQSAGLVQ
jgi:hypothetical protein